MHIHKRETIIHRYRHHYSRESINKGRDSIIQEIGQSPRTSPLCLRPPSCYTHEKRARPIIEREIIMHRVVLKSVGLHQNNKKLQESTTLVPSCQRLKWFDCFRGETMRKPRDTPATATRHPKYHRVGFLFGVFDPHPRYKSAKRQP